MCPLLIESWNNDHNSKEKFFQRIDPFPFLNADDNLFIQIVDEETDEYPFGTIVIGEVAAVTLMNVEEEHEIITIKTQQNELDAYIV